MRKTLDKLYLFSGVIAALLIAAICLLVTSQVVLNLITKIGGTSVAMTIPSYADFAGYFLAASSFLALAYTFTQDGHIRVTLLLRTLKGKKSGWFSEVFSLIVCAATSLFASYYMVHLVLESHRFGDKSSGIIAIPVWIPQSFVALGLIILSIAIIDIFIQTLINRRPVISSIDSE